MIYALRRKKMTIAEREETVHDLPPVPPVSNPDWFSIWNKNKVSDDKLTNDLTSELVKPLMVLITDPMERRRLRLLVRAFLMYRKLLIENSQVRLIQILRPADGAPGDRTARQLATSMNHLKLHFEECLKQMMSTRFEMFKKRLRKSMHQWTNSKQHFFYESKYDNAQGDNVLINEIIEANYRVLESIEELIHATRCVVDRPGRPAGRRCAVRWWCCREDADAADTGAQADTHSCFTSPHAAFPPFPSPPSSTQLSAQPRSDCADQRWPAERAGCDRETADGREHAPRDGQDSARAAAKAAGAEEADRLEERRPARKRASASPPLSRCPAAPLSVSSRSRSRLPPPLPLSYTRTPHCDPRSQPPTYPSRRAPRYPLHAPGAIQLGMD